MAVLFSNTHAIAMKKIIVTTFKSTAEAGNAVDRLHKDLGISTDEISYVYRNPDGEVAEIPVDDMTTTTPEEGAMKGASVGGAIGAIAGIATVAGLIPVIGPIFAAGPIVAALGLSGALGTTVAGAMTGALAGGVIGALTNLGIGKEEAEAYEKAVLGGDILIVVHSDKETEVTEVLTDAGAESVHVYEAVAM